MRIVKLGLMGLLAVVLLAFGGARLLPSLTAPRLGAAPGPIDGAMVERGRAVAEAADCVACHTAPGGRPYAGGLPMATPFGTVYSTNITPDAASGIGGYEFPDFERAVRHGIRADGAALYPAMPYVSYSVLTDGDVQALYAYFRSAVAAQTQTNRPPAMRWPASMRWPLAWWQLLFARHGGFTPPAGASEEVARGAYLVEGAGHCGTCHTPRGLAMQEKALTDDASGEFLSGAPIDGWYAKSLRHEDVGLGAWNAGQIAEFLHTGRTDRSAAFGSMAEVVEHSSQHLSAADAAAIAAYLVGRTARSGHAEQAALSQDGTTDGLRAGKVQDAGALAYVARCSACHRLDGQGSPRLFPALAGNAVVLTDDPSSLLRITLSGGAMARTPADRNRPSMPEFARLDDPAVAAILTFVRSSWGNRAPAVTVGQVAAMRALISGRPLETSTGDAGAEAVQAGRALALDRAKGNCLACHTIEGGDAPSSVGRELKGMRRKFPHREDLVEILNDEPSRNSIAPMPPFGRNHILTATEIDRIVDFLYTL